MTIGNAVRLDDGRVGTLEAIERGDTTGLSGVAALGVLSVLVVRVAGELVRVDEDLAAVCDGPGCAGCSVCDR